MRATRSEFYLGLQPIDFFMQWITLGNMHSLIIHARALCDSRCLSRSAISLFLITHSLTHSHTLYLFFCLSLSLSVSLCLCLSLTHSISPPHPPLSLSQALSLSPSLSLSFSVYLRASLPHSLSVHTRFWNRSCRHCRSHCFHFQDFSTPLPFFISGVCPHGCRIKADEDDASSPNGDSAYL